MQIYTTEDKKKIIKSFSPRSHTLKNSALAFLFGGLISLSAEVLNAVYILMGVSEENSLTLVGVTLILLSSALTALGVFDNVARVARAGTLVPITGFANAVTSEALDAKSEGLVSGVGSKIFTVAGPVILFGISSGIIYGIIRFIYLYIIM